MSGLTVRLRVTPNAGLDRIEGFETRDDGTNVLRIRVKAVPDKGKANAAVIALLAKALGVPKSSITLVSGEAARLKVVRIEGEAGELEINWPRWLDCISFEIHTCQSGGYHGHTDFDASRPN